MKVGERLKSTASTTEVIVVKVGDTVSGPLLCAGAPMSAVGSGSGAPPASRGATAGDAGLVIGKRYSGAGVEVLCVTPGTGPLSVDGVDLELTAPRPLPSSD
ncbi:hypothetical protein [Rhodococcus wratislaviensis]|uniref:Uncharacterized protein n=1 Tax=Rhodococcus wratislaviensis NBRC 100605 TaxID=1219028 RepID=X0PPS2_RHOWR|nr:hypothetical protein [Rhodococcus wratislaviensis]GAF44713.1 hypothetical protein RW1_014_01760 [Rhodococcus wratislaviensis NBRC 100605]